MVETTHITLPAEAISYPIHVGPGLLNDLALFVQKQLPQTRRTMVITNNEIASHYLARVTTQLEGGGFEVFNVTIPSGEAHKTQTTLENLYNQALSVKLRRNDAAIALGGGIIGDITGFFSATYQRGIPFIQVPTTLLAQVDAAVGGKVAVNWHHYKNMIGAFYHPKGVLIDTDTLLTLPPRELACGMAEVIKYAFLEQSVPAFTPDRTMLSLLLERLNQGTLTRNLEAIILRCCQIKAAVVQADPEERRGIREMLNLGHTFAHAYETLSHGDIPHGEAVAMGMVNAMALAIRRHEIAANAMAPLTDLLTAANLPLKPPTPWPAEAIVEKMAQDKKAVDTGTLRLVLPVAQPGKVQVLNGILPTEVVQALQSPLEVS